MLIHLYYKQYYQMSTPVVKTNEHNFSFRGLTRRHQFRYNPPVMKQGLHPDNYRLVVFEDTSNGFRFLTRSTAKSEEVTKWEDGNEYPLIQVHISSESHPFYTGQEKLVDIEGRVDRFKARQEAAKKHAEATKKAATKKSAKQDEKGDIDVQKIGGKPKITKPTEA